MSDGIAPVNTEGVATSAIPAKEDSRTIHLGFEDKFIYTVWRKYGNQTPVIEHGDYDDFTTARNEARKIGGYLTEQKIIGDFTR